MKKGITAVAAMMAVILLSFPALATRLDDALSEYRLGLYADAFRHLSQLAGEGNPEAMFWVGAMWHKGKGVRQNYQEAMNNYQKASEMGNSNAQNNIGLMYRDGHGVSQNFTQAYAWFTLAAGNGNPTATQNRDDLSARMSPKEIVLGQELAEGIKQKARPLFHDSRSVSPPTVTANNSKPNEPQPIQAIPPLIQRGGDFWVQVGTFKNTDGVRKIENTAQEEKLPLQIDKAIISGETHFRIRIGPYISEEEARNKMSRIDELFKVRSKLRKLEN